jgi:hypothetical protein
MSKQWEFINSAIDGKASNLKTVRRNAMRAFRESERLKRVNQYRELQAKQQQSISDEQNISHDESVQALPRQQSGTSVSSGMSSQAGLLHAASCDSLWKYIPPEIAVHCGYDPFSSTTLNPHHDSPKLFFHCMLHL